MILDMVNRSGLQKLRPEGSEEDIGNSGYKGPEASMGLKHLRGNVESGVSRVGPWWERGQKEQHVGQGSAGGL